MTSTLFTRPRRRFVAVVLACLATFWTGVAFAGDAEKRNDVVLHDRNSNGPADYVEVFKKEGTNGKNYLYTITQVVTSGGMYCTVVTFASETAGSATCVTRDQVSNPSAFIVLDPARYPDGPPR